MDSAIGSELPQPLGVAVVGGPVVAQALTLFATPVTYLYMGRLREWFSRSGGRERPSPIPHALVRAGSYPRPAVLHKDAAE